MSETLLSSVREQKVLSDNPRSPSVLLKCITHAIILILVVSLFSFRLHELEGACCCSELMTHARPPYSIRVVVL